MVFDVTDDEDDDLLNDELVNSDLPIPADVFGEGPILTFEANQPPEGDVTEVVDID